MNYQQKVTQLHLSSLQKRDEAPSCLLAGFPHDCVKALYTDSHPTLFTSNLLLLFIYYLFTFFIYLFRHFITTSASQASDSKVSIIVC